MIANLDRAIMEAALRESPAALAEMLGRFDIAEWATVRARIRLPKAAEDDTGAGGVFIPRPYQIEPLKDLSSEVIWRKASQIGLSTLAIIRLCWFLTELPATAIYTMPTSTDISDFTKQRINPIITRTPYLAERIVDVDSVETKQFTRMPRQQYRELVRQGLPTPPLSTATFSGAWTERDPTSVDADMLIHDEEDRSNPSVIEEFKSRLDGSSIAWTLRLSTPTFPGVGVDGAYARSDQRHWLIRCPGCRDEFEMQYPRNIDPSPEDQEDARKLWAEVEEGRRMVRYRCHRCGATIGDQDRAGGRWEPERPGVAAHGYYLSQLSVAGIPAERILKRHAEAKYPAIFHNTVLGLAYQSGTNAMPPTAILEAIIARGGHSRHTITARYLGIDVGRCLDWIAEDYDDGGAPRVLDLGRITHADPRAKWDQIDALIVDRGISVAVIDGRPEETEAAEFAKRHPGIVWRAYYYTPGRNAPPVIRWNTDEMTVSAPRTDTLTAVSRELLARMILPAFDGTEEYQAFLDHLDAAKEVPVYQAGGEREGLVDHYEWANTGPDHLFHAGVYAYLARQAPDQTGAPAVGFATASRADVDRTEGGPGGYFVGMRGRESRRRRWG